MKTFHSCFYRPQPESFIDELFVWNKNGILLRSFLMETEMVEGIDEIAFIIGFIILGIVHKNNGEKLSKCTIFLCIKIKP